MSSLEVGRIWRIKCLLGVNTHEGKGEEVGLCTVRSPTAYGDQIKPNLIGDLYLPQFTLNTIQIHFPIYVWEVAPLGFCWSFLPEEKLRRGRLGGQATVSVPAVGLCAANDTHCFLPPLSSLDFSNPH